MDENVTELKVVCAWCRRHMRGPTAAPPNLTSHGICAACQEQVWHEHHQSLSDSVRSDTTPDQSVWGMWVDHGGEG